MWQWKAGEKFEKRMGSCVIFSELSLICIRLGG
jgi:hypothetical protein